MRNATPRLLLANAWIYGALAALTALALLAAAPWLLWNRLRGVRADVAVRDGIWRYGRVCLTAIRPFVAIEVLGGDSLIGRGPAIVAANHQSALDIYLLAAQDTRNVCLLVRSWPFRRLFFFRPLMRLAGYVETEASTPEDILSRCREELAAGAHVLGFPEGTRSRDGALGKFHSGLFKLAAETGTPVAPLVIRGSRDILPPGARLFRPGRVRIELLPPADPADFAGETIPHGALRRRVRAMIQERLEASE